MRKVGDVIVEELILDKIELKEMNNVIWKRILKRIKIKSID